MTAPAFDEAKLVEHIVAQRWFGSKTREVTGAHTLDAAIVSSRRAAARGRARRGPLRHGHARALPAAVRGARRPARVRRARTISRSRASVVAADPRRRDRAGRRGRVRVPLGARVRRRSAATWSRCARSTAEQSNTSLVIEDELIFKVYRRLEAGINPELELLRFLTARGFPNAPGPGRLVRVPRPAAGVDARHPAELRSRRRRRLRPRARRAASATPTASSARLRRLGEVTGELHTVLGSEPDDPAFTPRGAEHRGARPAHRDDRRGDRADLQRAARRRPRWSRSPAASRRCASGSRGSPASARSAASSASTATTTSARRSGRDERLGDHRLRGRAGPLARRAAPQALAAARRGRDAALVRLRRLGRARSCTASSRPPTGRTARARSSSAATSTRSSRPCCRAAREAIDRLLAIFELEKAVYELRYELDHRPDWVSIPVAGIERLLAARTTRRDRDRPGATRTGRSGRTRPKGGVVVRALRPEASSVRVLPYGVELEHVGDRASSRGSSRAPKLPLDYELEVAYPGRRRLPAPRPVRVPAHARRPRPATSSARAATRSCTRGSAPTSASSTASPASRFAVWAPNASAVSVVGDFNGWDGRLHPHALARLVRRLGAVRARGRARGALQVRGARRRRAAAR